MRKFFLAALVALCLLTAGRTRADVFGRLQIRVKGAPAGARVTLRDMAGVRGDITVVTGKDGRALTPLLEDHGWRLVRVATAGGKAPARLSGEPTVSVAADTTTDVTITLDPVRNTVVAVTSGDGAQTALVYRRDRGFIRKYPLGTGDPQKLGPVLQTVPGVSR